MRPRTERMLRDLYDGDPPAEIVAWLERAQVNADKVRYGVLSNEVMIILATACQMSTQAPAAPPRPEDIDVDKVAEEKTKKKAGKQAVAT